MKAHYYLIGWYESNLPKKLVKALSEDITERKSLVTITTKPSDYKYHESEYIHAKNEWLGAAGITFDEYHWIDYGVSQEEAHEVIREASVIFMMGGDPMLQNDFLVEYELSTPIKESKANVVMGVSAGSINMSAKWLCSPNNKHWYKGESKIYNGLGLDPFFFEIYFSPDNETFLKEELLPAAQGMEIYASCNESAIRMKNGEMEILGDVYFIANGEIQKVPESGFTE